MYGLLEGSVRLTLLKAWNGGDLFAAYGGFFALQMVCFLGAALMTRRLDVVGFRNTVKPRFADVMEMACLLYTSPSPRDRSLSRMPSSA